MGLLITIFMKINTILEDETQLPLEARYVDISDLFMITKAFGSPNTLLPLKILLSVKIYLGKHTLSKKYSFILPFTLNYSSL